MLGFTVILMMHKSHLSTNTITYYQVKSEFKMIFDYLIENN
jgi:hypothetical protein